MLTIIFNNQDYYEGMINKYQKPFMLNNVTKLEMYADPHKFVNGNMYLYKDDEAKPSNRIELPQYMFGIIKNFCEKRNLIDDSNEHTIIVNCIMSKWTLEYSYNKKVTTLLAA